MRNLVKLLQLVVGLHVCVSDCFVVITPRNQAVIAGQRMEMECRTSNGWFVRKWWFHGFTNPSVIKMFEVYNISGLYAAEKLSPSGFGVDVDKNGSGVFYSNETKVEHAGSYACRAESTGGKESVYSAALIVLHSEPVCETNTSEDYIVMQCKVRFRGGWSPTVEWKQHGADASEEYLMTNVTHANNHSDRTITSSLLVSLSLIKGDSFFTFMTYFEWHNNSIIVDATNIPNFNCTWSSHNLSKTCSSVLDNTTDIPAVNTGEWLANFFAARNRTERNSNSDIETLRNTERIQESDGDRIDVYNAMNGQGSVEQAEVTPADSSPADNQNTTIYENAAIVDSQSATYMRLTPVAIQASLPVYASIDIAGRMQFIPISLTPSPDYENMTDF